MKSLISLLSLLVGQISADAQCDTSLIGKWKIVAIFNGEVYLNLKTDSTSLTDEMRKLYPTFKEQKELIENAKNIYGDTKFIFTKDGELIFEMASLVKDTSKYCYNSTRNKLQITPKNSNNQDETNTSSTNFINGLFHFNYKWGTSVYTVDLEKVN